MALYAEMVRSNVPEDEYLSKELGRYFPAPLQKRYTSYLREHPLAREIIATMVTNSLVNRMGSVFAFRMQDETGADVAGVARAFTIAREIFEIRATWEAIESLDNQVAAAAQQGMLRSTQALLKQATRWLLDRREELPDIAAAVARLAPGIRALAECLPEVLQGSRLERYEGALQLYAETGLPPALARRVAALAPLHTALDIIALAENCDVDVRHAAEIYFRVGDALQLDWVADQVEQAARRRVCGRPRRAAACATTCSACTAPCARRSSAAAIRVATRPPSWLPGRRPPASARRISARPWKKCVTQRRWILLPCLLHCRKCVAWHRTDPAPAAGGKDPWPLNR